MSGKLQLFLRIAVLTLLGSGLTRAEVNNDGLNQYPPSTQEDYGFPRSPCPQLFTYKRDNFNAYYGELTIPNQPPASYFRIEVNMSVNAEVDKRDNMKISVISPQNEIIYGPVIRYSVKFPHVPDVPYLTLVVFNGREMCRGEPPMLQPGKSQTMMWAANTITTSNDNGYPTTPPYPPYPTTTTYPLYPPYPTTTTYPPYPPYTTTLFPPYPPYTSTIFPPYPPIGGYPSSTGYPPIEGTPPQISEGQYNLRNYPPIVDGHETAGDIGYPKQVIVHGYTPPGREYPASATDQTIGGYPQRYDPNPLTIGYPTTEGYRAQYAAPGVRGGIPKEDVVVVQAKLVDQKE